MSGTVDLHPIFEKVKALAGKAGDMMLTAVNVAVENKETKDNYVTSTDVAIQKFLRKELTELLPGSFFLGEEDDLPSAEKETVRPGQYFWIVDPIDGTANYARHIPASVVSIALARDGEVVFGVVRNPYLDETFSALKGEGAFLNGKPIRVSDRTKEHAVVSTAWSTYNKKRAPACFRISQELYYICEDIRRIGTAAYEMCLVAKGAEEMLFEINLSPWDYAAASRILKEAGGFTSSLDGDLDLLAPCTVMAANREDSLSFLKNIVEKDRSSHGDYYGN